MIRYVILPLVFFISACSSGGDFTPPEFLHNPAFYFGDSTKVTLNVYYEPEAEPFSGDLASTNPIISKIWDISFLNFEEIFSFKSESTEVFVPRELSEMKAMDALNKDVWTVEDIIDLAIEKGVVSVKENESILTVFFVKGFFQDSGQVKNNVVGVNLSGTSITLIFKDVILNMPPNLRVFSEQATVVHEVGHALGLVDNGVPATGSHFDGLNGAHSNEDECIMFHLNEGAADLTDFIISLNTTGDATLWGLGVLKDVEAFSQ